MNAKELEIRLLKKRLNKLESESVQALKKVNAADEVRGMDEVEIFIKQIETQLKRVEIILLNRLKQNEKKA